MVMGRGTVKDKGGTLAKPCDGQEERDSGEQVERNKSTKEAFDGTAGLQRGLREVCPGFAEPHLRRQLDEIEEERLLRAGCRDRAEM